MKLRIYIVLDGDDSRVGITTDQEKAERLAKLLWAGRVSIDDVNDQHVERMIQELEPILDPK